MGSRPKGPAPADLIIPGGTRDRALRAVQMRGPRPEDRKKTWRSQEHWRRFREQQKHARDEAAE